MKTRYFFNTLAVLGICATIITCYCYYDYNRREGLSPVLVWGSAPLMIFVVVTSVLQLRRSIRRRRSS